MPITSSAKKALRASKTKRVYNLRRKGAIDSVYEALKKCVSAKDKKGAEALVPRAYQALDKAVKTGFIKKNAAARSKARFQAAIRRSS